MRRALGGIFRCVPIAQNGFIDNAFGCRHPPKLEGVPDHEGLTGLRGIHPISSMQSGFFASLVFCCLQGFETGPRAWVFAPVGVLGRGLVAPWGPAVNCPLGHGFAGWLGRIRWCQ